MGKLSQARVRELLSYDPETGHLTWLRTHARRRSGDRAGFVGMWGNRRLRIDGILREEHRVIWLHVYGDLPPKWIDHINGDRADNRLVNLRAADETQNRANSKIPRTNTSGFKGVSWNRRERKWRSQIRFRHRSIFLGQYETREQAALAYKSAAIKYFGEFAETERGIKELEGQ